MKLITPISLIIISVALFFVYIDPTYQASKEIKLQVDEYQKLLDQSKSLVAEENKLRAAYNALPQDDVKRLEKLLPSAIDNVRLIIDIDNIASKYGIQVKNTKLSDINVQSSKTNTLGVSQKKYESVPISFSVNASYETFISFLKDLEQSLRVMDVTGISLTSSTNGVYTYEVTIKTYWLK